MTSNEFSRRLHYYVNFLTAFDCFHDGSSRDHIWKITVLEAHGIRTVEYSYSPYFTPSDLFKHEDIETVVIERYSKCCFNVDVKYFKSFLSKLSDFQFACINTDSRFTNILKFINDVEK